MVLASFVHVSICAATHVLKSCTGTLRQIHCRFDFLLKANGSRLATTELLGRQQAGGKQQGNNGLRPVKVILGHDNVKLRPVQTNVHLRAKLASLGVALTILPRTSLHV